MNGDGHFGGGADSGGGGQAGAGGVDWSVVEPILRRDPYRLCPREVEVLCGIFRGESYRTIARALGCRHHTVDSHWRRLKSKLNVTNHTEAIHRVYEIEKSGAGKASGIRH